MSPISSDDLHRIFKNLDKSNEGLVSVDDLHRLLDKIGARTTSDELQKLVGKTSLNYIDFFFFYDAMVKARLAEQEEGDDTSDHAENDLLKAFEVFDLDGDGYITCEELQTVLSRLGLLDKRKDCKDMIRVFDDNSDGVLDFQEFKNMMSVPSTSDSDT